MIYRRCPCHLWRNTVVGRYNGAMLLDSAVLPWDDPRIQRLRKSLMEAYPSGAAALDLVSAVRGFPQHDVNWRGDYGASAIWKTVLDCAARANVLRNLVNRVLNDPSVAGHHVRIRAIVTELDADADPTDDAERSAQTRRPTPDAVQAEDEQDIEPKVGPAIKSPGEILVGSREPRMFGKDEPAYGAILIFLPDTARLVPVRSIYPNITNPDFVGAKCEWRVTKATDDFEIVRAQVALSRRREPIEGRVSLGNGYISTSFAFYMRPGKPNVEERPPRVRGKVTLVDGRNEYHEYKVIFK
jgi:Effector-associated domain 1